MPIQGYSAIAYDANDATSNYHSLQITANRRFTHGIQFGVAYTWSKAMDWVDTDYGAVNNAVPASLFRAWNYGLASFDRTQILNINWMWDVPKWRSAMDAAAPRGQRLAHFWRRDFLERSAGGSHVSRRPPRPTLPVRRAYRRASCVIGNPYQLQGGHGPLQAFNPTVFALPATGTLGDTSKNLVRGPGIENFNISLVKEHTRVGARPYAVPRGDV